MRIAYNLSFGLSWGNFMKKQAKQLGLVLIAFVGLTALYNNCQGPQSIEISNLNTALDPNSTDSKDLLQQEAIATLDFTKSNLAEICSVGENFSCEQRVFSALAQDAARAGIVSCTHLDDGSELCAKTQEWSFNTSEAIKNCNGCDINEYERSEYSCYFNQAMAQGIFPIQAEGETIQDALKGAHVLCHNLLLEQSLQ
jgi:hypothetical protein